MFVKEVVIVVAVSKLYRLDCFEVKVHIRKLPFFPQKLAVTRGAKRYMNEGERINRSGDICFQTGRKIAF